jgi:hypothetical protein
MPDVTDYLTLGRDHLFPATGDPVVDRDSLLKGIGFVLLDIAKTLRATAPEPTPPVQVRMCPKCHDIEFSAR